MDSHSRGAFQRCAPLARADWRAGGWGCAFVHLAASRLRPLTAPTAHPTIGAAFSGVWFGHAPASPAPPLQDSKCIGSMASYPLDVSSGATVGNVTLRPPTLASAATLLEFATPAAREEFDARGGVADAACEPLEVINLGQARREPVPARARGSLGARARGADQPPLYRSIDRSIADRSSADPRGAAALAIPRANRAGARQGTTATHGTAMIMRTAAPNFAHWNLHGATKPEVARSHHNRLLFAYLSLRKCAQDAPGRVLGGGALPSPSGQSGPDDHPCLARNILPKLADAMLAAVGRGCGMTHLHDSPYPLFAASILRALEGSAHVAYMQSLRDPLDWARHRANDHGTTFLCSPEGAAGARSFFDIAVSPL